MIKRILFVLFVIGASFLYQKYKTRPQVSAITFTPLKPHTKAVSDTLSDCKLSSYCLVTYVAPWCPACHSYLNELRPDVENALERRQYKSIVIVGSDELSQVEQMVEQIGTRAFADVEDQFRDTNKISFFPTHIVLENGRLKYFGQKSYDWINSELLNP
ncbi:MAG: TlpA family protein disulfide reductase [Pseudobdellovibrio sp.]